MSDCQSRDCGFKLHLHAVLCPRARHIYSKKYWLISRKRWVDVTEKLLTGMLNLELKLNK